MKRCLLLLCLFALLSACGPAPKEEREPPEPEVLQFDSLSVEVSRAGLSPEELSRAVRELPEALKAALARRGVEAGEVTVTVGSSAEATAQAVRDGGVDLAFLPAEEFAALDSPPEVILAAGPLSATDSFDEISGPHPGACVLICAAPTESGASLLQAAEDGKLTWEAVSQVRWGFPREDALLGHQAVDLWLWDQYGKTTADLEHVTVCDDYESLFRSAAEGDIDLLPLWDGLLEEWAEVWTMDPAQTGGGGVRGLGRSAPLREEVQRLAVTERFYTGVAVVRPGSGELEEPSFQSALAEAVNELLAEQPVLGSEPYGPAVSGDLDPQRRLTALAR